MKKYYLILFIIVFYQIPFVGYTQEIRINALNNPAPGYLFMDSYSLNKFSLIDNSGFEVHQSSLNGLRGALQNVTLQQNGLITFYNFDSFSNVGRFYSMNNKFEIVDTFSCTSQYRTDYHEFKFLSNGNYLMLGIDTRTIDMSQVIHNGNPNARVDGHIIQEFDSQHRLIWEWNTFDHFQFTDIVDTLMLLSPNIDYVHCNSFCEDFDGNIILSSRHFDEITKINRTTGEIMWRMGGSNCKNNQFNFVNDTRNNFFGFSYQHDVQLLPNGHLLIFDNESTNQADPDSRAVEYEINDIARTVTKVWEYRHTPGILSNSQGSVQRLPNGNSLICWGDNFQGIIVTEIDTSANTVFEMSGSIYLSYRALRFVYKMAAVTRNISTLDSYDFNESNNQTHINLTVDSLTGMGNVSIEAHDYQAHNKTFSSTPPASVFSGRWVMSGSSISRFKGVIKFNLDAIDTFPQPEKIEVFYRAKEGSGAFKVLTTKYNSSTRQLEAKFNGFGEYILGIKDLDSVSLDFPIDNSIGISTNSLKIRWRKYSDSVTYRVQISTTPSFSSQVFDQSGISDTSCFAPPLANYTKYYWRVNFLRNGLTSSWSHPWTFTTDLPAPGLIFPTDSLNNLSIFGRFSWEKVSRALSYNIMVSETPNFIVPIINATTAKTEFEFKELKFNKMYYWKVQTVNGVYLSKWSAIRSFRTKLDTTQLIFPLRNELGVNPKFLYCSWNKVVGATNYNLQIAKDSDFVQVVSNHLVLSDTFYLEKNLTSNSEYFWKVSGSNDYSSGEWSEIRKFSTALTPPDLLQPTNKAMNVKLSTEIKWESIPSASFYYLQVSSDSLFKTLIVDNPKYYSSTYKLQNLEYDKTYFWRVMVTTTGGISTWSDIWEFQTRQEFYIEKPMLKSPGSEVYNQLLAGIFEWDPTPSAISYNLELSESINFDVNKFQITDLDQTNFNYKDLEYNKQYFWRVQAVGSKSISDWSDTYSFFTLLDTPVMLNPDNSAINVSLNTVFKWNNVEGATEYALQFGRDEGFYIRTDKTVNGNEITNIGWLNGFSKYFWRVKALSGKKEGLWSQAWSFTTDHLSNVDPNVVDFNLSIFPNPSDQLTHINLSIKTADTYIINIYDNEGNLIDRFSDQFLSEGTFKFPWSAKYLRSGNYRVVVTNNKFSSSKDFIILK